MSKIDDSDSGYHEDSLKEPLLTFRINRANTDFTVKSINNINNINNSQAYNVENTEQTAHFYEDKEKILKTLKTSKFEKNFEEKILTYENENENHYDSKDLEEMDEKDFIQIMTTENKETCGSSKLKILPPLTIPKNIDEYNYNLYTPGYFENFDTVSLNKNLFQGEDTLTYSEALLKLWKSSLPSIIAFFFIFLNDSINIIFAGKYFCPEEISAVGLGMFYLNSMGFILGIGILGGLDTICSQSFGAKQYHVISLFTNITKVVLFFYAILIITPCLFASKFILSAILPLEHENIISLTSSYVTYLIPYAIFSLQYNTSSRYLQSMNVFLPSMMVTMCTTILHPFWCYVFCVLLNLGIRGIALAMGVTAILNFILINVYIENYNPYPKTSENLKKENLEWKRILDFLKLGISSGIIFSSDWLGFEIIILLSGYLNKTALAANVIMFTFVSLIGTIAFGLNISTTTLVGNAIGRGRSNSAKKISVVSILSGLIIILLISFFIFLYKDYFPFIYTNDKDVADILTKLVGFYLYFALIDALESIFKGIVKGLGKQKIASIFVLIVLFPINIPLSITFAFTMNYGLAGLWTAQMCSVSLLCFSYLILIMAVDLENVILRAIVRIKLINKKLKKQAARIKS